MPFKILKKRKLAPLVYDFVVEAPKIATHAKPGHFIVVRLHERGERIPLTIADTYPEEGSFRMIVRAVGKTTYELCMTREGDEILDVVGPLGKPSEIERFGKVLLIGGGVGIATLYPIAKALKAAGNEITTVLGGRSAEYVIMRDEFEKLGEVFITTDDGSLGMKGLVTDGMEYLVKDKGMSFDIAWAVGPTIMMKFCALKGKELGIPKMWVSLNPIMVDGTGMCGACRVTVGGEIKFACVDGPEFDGYQVEWDELLRRMDQYKELEKRALERFLEKVGDVSWL